MTVERGIHDAAFVSYHRKDGEFALRLATELKAAGASVWLDQDDLLPGQDWIRAVEDALTNCPRMLVILSPDSVNSKNVLDEVSFALASNKAVIPIMYKDCVVPFRLKRLQCVDFRREQERGLKQLLEILPSGRSENRERQHAAERAQAEPKMRIENFRRTVAEHLRREEEPKQIAAGTDLKKAETASLTRRVPSAPGGNVSPSGVDIFLSHQRSDAEKARMLADAFQREGLSVWWDHRIPPGKTWAEVIESSIKRSRCVVVLWSKTSVNSKWVKKEARFAEKRACLIPILIDAVDPPFEFEDVQAADLTDWEGERTEAFLNLVAELRSRLQIGSSTVVEDALD